jgi:hypothetical protein
MHDPTEPDRHEILNGPGEGRRAAKSRANNKKKIAVIAASALVAALAVGGAGYVLTSGGDGAGTPAQQSRQADPGQGSGTGTEAGAQDEGRPLEDDAADEATMGDADLPEEEAAEMGDAVADDPAGDTGNTGNTSNARGSGDQSKKGTASKDNGAKNDNSGKKPQNAAKPPQNDEGDNPADGPAGAVEGQCAKDGC